MEKDADTLKAYEIMTHSRIIQKKYPSVYDIYHTAQRAETAARNSIEYAKIPEEKRESFQDAERSLAEARRLLKQCRREIDCYKEGINNGYV